MKANKTDNSHYNNKQQPPNFQTQNDDFSSQEEDEESEQVNSFVESTGANKRGTRNKAQKKKFETEQQIRDLEKRLN